MQMRTSQKSEATDVAHTSQPEQDDTRIELVLAVISIALGVFSVLTTLIAVYISHTPVPYYDAWDYWRTYPDLIAKPLSTLFSQHNEHRIAALRLLLLGDHFLFSGTGNSLQFCILAVQTVSTLLLWKVAARGVTRLYSAFLFGILVTMMFSLHQYENFSWPFQIGFVLAYGGTLASFAALRKSSMTTGVVALGWMALSLFAACLATYSLASGLMVWLLLPILAWYIGLSSRRVGAIALCSLFVLTTYLYSYVRPGHHADPVAVLFEPQKLAVFALAYLGSPVDELSGSIRSLFGYTSDFSRVVWCVGAGLVVTVFSGWRIVRVFAAGRRGDSGALMLAHMMLFLFASALLTALGRANFGLTAALWGRYTTPALMLWACALTLLLPGFRTRDRSPSSLLSQVRFRWIVIICVVFIFTATQLSRIAYARSMETNFADSRAGVTIGVYQDDAWRKLYHTPGLLIRPITYMREYKLAAASDPWASFIGHKLSDHFHVPASAAPVACLGFVDSSTPTQSSFWPGYRLQGWAWDVQNRRAPEGVVFADTGGRIRGFARIVQWRPDVLSAIGSVTERKTGWIGYARGNHQETLTAYAAIGNNGLCQIAAVKVSEIFPELPFDKAAGALGSPNTSARGVWHSGADPSSPPPPQVGTALSSQTTAGNGTGVLEIGPLDASGVVTLGLPILPGPVTGRLSVTVLDADTGVTMAYLQPPPASETWRLWRVDLLGIAGLRIKIIAEDNGEGPGEHMAIGLPLAVRP